jgi:pyridoxal 5'-phosphate synthase pdxT subunit
MKIGVLAAQGAFIEHIAVLKKLGSDAIPVRLPEELDGLDGLIIPGGESTTISKLMRDYKLTDIVKERAQNGMALYGTCAGLVLLAKEIPGSNVTPLGLMDYSVKRNAFGRQRESFETELAMPVLGEKPFHAVFIRAPAIGKIWDGIQVLATLENGICVAARQNKMLVSAFHPELTDDTRFHRYFLDIVAGAA